MLMLITAASIAFADFITAASIIRQSFDFRHSYSNGAENLYEISYLFRILRHYFGKSIDFPQHLVVFSSAFQLAHAPTMPGFRSEVLRPSLVIR
jgi:hypothetical protein